MIGTGEAHTVREFVEGAFALPVWTGRNTWRSTSGMTGRRKWIRCERTSKARSTLGWEPAVTFDELVRLMVDADLKAVRKPGSEAGPRRFGSR